MRPRSHFLTELKGYEPIFKINFFLNLKSLSRVFSQFLIFKEAQTVIHRSQYENQFDVKIETDGEKVVVKKEKKMSERKRRYVFGLRFNDCLILL
jgi:hypothetical protein